MRSYRWLLVAALVAGAAQSAQAQLRDADRPRTTPSRAFLGVDLLVAQPVGEFADHVDAGFGIGVSAIGKLKQSGAAALRFDLGFLQYGNESRNVRPFPNIPRIRAELNTDNSIVFASFGPQLMVPDGRIRPYINAGIGLTYFYTQSSLEGEDDDNEDLFETKHSDDAMFAWTAGAGLYIPVKRGLRPISIDLSARYHGNGTAEYVTEGGITDRPDGSGVDVNPVRSKANFLTYKLGVSIGM